MDTLSETKQSGKVYQPLEGGLVLRQATPADRENLIEFNRQIFDAGSGKEVAYLLDELHPNFRVEDFLVVVDRDERVISTLCLIETEWQFGQTRLRLGQPEFVGTLAEYRGRGLVRLQFDILHRWMKERGLAFGLIGGIDYYYRQFGYEYGVDLHRAGTLTVEQHSAHFKMPDGVVVRPALESDIPALRRLHEARNAGVDLVSVITETAWRWAVKAHRLSEVETENWIALKDGQPLGSARIYGKPENLIMTQFTGGELAATALIAKAFELPGIVKIQVGVDPASPMGRWLVQFKPVPLRSPSWYIRVNDPVLAFRQLAGEFERRIAVSSFAGLDREIELGCYRFGIQLVFEKGQLTQVNMLPGKQDPKIGIPPDLLPKLLMGYRDLDELSGLYPDLSAAEDWELLKVLFPRLTSNIRFIL